MTKGKKKQFTGFDKSTLNKSKPSLSKFDKESTNEKDSPKRPRIHKESDLPKIKSQNHPLQLHHLQKQLKKMII